MIQTTGLDKNSRIYIAGHNGLVGSAIWRALGIAGFANLIGHRSSQVDLRNQEQTARAIEVSKPCLLYTSPSPRD